MQQLEQPLHCNYALAEQISIHQRKCSFYAYYSHCAALKSAALLLRRVRRVVGRYHIYRAVRNALEQRLAVCG